MFYGHSIVNDSYNDSSFNVKYVSKYIFIFFYIIFSSPWVSPPHMVTLCVVPIAQIKTNVKAVMYTCLSTNVVSDHSIQSALCLYIIFSLPEPRRIVIHAQMISQYKQFNPLHILVSICISQHYPSFVIACAK